MQIISINNIKIIGCFLLSLTLIISIFNIISNTLESIRERMNEIGILKTIRYLNLDILKCFSIETLFISSLSVLLNLIISGSLLLNNKISLKWISYRNYFV